MDQEPSDEHLDPRGGKHDVDANFDPNPDARESQARAWLRLEGLAALIAGGAIYGYLGGNWLAFVPLLLVPDLSAAGYLGGARLGAFTYNLIHNWATGLAVFGAGIALSAPILLIAGAVLIAHVGMDRAVGYGLKLTSGFGDTHLGHMGGARRSRTTDATERPTQRPATVAASAATITEAQTAQ